MAAAKGKKKVFSKMLIETLATEESLVQTGTLNQFWHGQQKTDLAGGSVRFFVGRLFYIKKKFKDGLLRMTKLLYQ
jgi:hypothetical protein